MGYNTNIDTGRSHVESIPAGITQRQLSTLQEEFTQGNNEKLQERLQNPKLLWHEMIQQQGSALIGRLQSTGAAYRERINGSTQVTTAQTPDTPPPQSIRDAIGSISEAPESTRKELTDIMDAITNIPDYEESTRPQHRYLLPRTVRTRDDDPRRVTIFNANFTAMKRDRETLDRLKTLHPQLAPQFSILQQAIGEMERAHPGLDAQLKHEGNVSYTDQAFKHFGKTAAFGALTLAAIIFGTIAVINRKFDAKALIALAAAALVASPGLRRMLTNGKFENDLAQVETAVNDHTLDLMAQYDIQGDIWGNLVDRMHTSTDEEMKKAITALQNGKHANLSQEELETLARSLMPGDSVDVRTARANLEQLMRSGHFPGLVRSLRAPRSPDGRDTVRDFVVAGSAKTAKELRAVERIQEEREALPAPERVATTIPSGSPTSLPPSA